MMKLNLRSTLIAGAAAILAAVTGAYAVQVINDNLTVNGTVTQTNGAVSFAGAATFSGGVTTTGAITPTAGVAAAGGFAFNGVNPATCGRPANLSTDGTDVTPAVTETFVAPVFVPANRTFVGVSLFNGSAVAGNVTVALADSAGTPIAAAKSATTAQSGTDAFQRIPFAAPYAAVGPATYYVQVQFDNTGARMNAILFGDYCNTTKQTGQVYGTLTAFTPPTTFTASVGPYAALYSTN